VDGVWLEEIFMIGKKKNPPIHPSSAHPEFFPHLNMVNVLN